MGLKPAFIGLYSEIVLPCATKRVLFANKGGIKALLRQYKGAF
ncbi:hypothetical protein SAMN04488524_3414 [Pedobacter africanus]|uniref:Uncharacterized protein n=1 Tax=Pedobacter africanus TaxID=151894 RepID=A0A1W2CYA7_9SPHI|nr:hypothetical protein SAMN04488524_3414 [Pedobacter africanus]